MKTKSVAHSESKKAWREHKQVRRDKRKTYSSERHIGWANRVGVERDRRYEEALAWADNKVA